MRSLASALQLLTTALGSYVATAVTTIINSVSADPHNAGSDTLLKPFAQYTLLKPFAQFSYDTVLHHWRGLSRVFLLL